MSQFGAKSIVVNILCSDSCRIHICQNGYHKISANTWWDGGGGGGGERDKCEGDGGEKRGGRERKRRVQMGEVGGRGR